MISSSESQGSATALYLNISRLDEAKSVIGASQAVPFLVQLLQRTTENQCKLDALHALYNLSTYSPNISALLSSNIIKSLQGLLASTGENLWIEKSLAVMLNLASSQEGKDEVVSSQEKMKVLNRESCRNPCREESLWLDHSASSGRKATRFASEKEENITYSNNLCM